MNGHHQEHFVVVNDAKVRMPGKHRPRIIEAVFYKLYRLRPRHAEVVKRGIHRRKPISRLHHLRRFDAHHAVQTAFHNHSLSRDIDYGCLRVRRREKLIEQVLFR